MEIHITTAGNGWAAFKVDGDYYYLESSGCFWNLTSPGAAFSDPIKKWRRKDENVNSVIPKVLTYIINFAEQKCI